MPDEPYVVDGEWLDREWILAAAKRDRSDSEHATRAAGPRRHPWGPLAVERPQEDGRVFFFPTDDAYSAWQAQRGATEVVATLPEPAVEVRTDQA